MFSYRGFTLVELMIVIAIIGILAASLFPSVTGYMERAHDTKKMNELREITMAINAFRTDLETYMIPGVGWMGGSLGWVNYKDGSTYTKTIMEGLSERGYIRDASKFIIPATYSANPITKNMSPCNVSGGNQDMYMYYFDDSLDRYSLTAYLRYPSNKHIENILISYNGSGANGTCTTYGMNFSIGN